MNFQVVFFSVYQKVARWSSWYQHDAMQTALTNNHDPYSHNRDGRGESHDINIMTDINCYNQCCKNAAWKFKYKLKRTTLTLLVIFRLDIAMLTLPELDSDREQSE